jgi:acetyl esterase/lipase
MILALAKAYLGGAGDARDPLVSPLYADLSRLPPLLIHAGDRETVRDDATMLAEKAGAAGVDVELQVWDGMIHVFQMFPEIPQAQEAVASIAAFLRRHLHLSAERAG